MAIVASACGRVGFERAIDAPVVPPDAAPCRGTVQQLPVDTAGQGTWVTAFTATPIAGGFAIGYVAPDAQGFALTFSTTGAFATLAADTQITPNETGIQVLGLGGRVVVAPTTATDTQLLPYSPALAAMGAGSTRASRTPVARALALAGDGTTAAFVDTASGQDVTGRLIASDGTDAGAARTLVPASAQPTTVVVRPAPDGYVVAYASTLGAHTSNALIVDAQLAVVTPATEVGDGANTTAAEANVVVAAAPAQGAYLFVWEETHGSDAQIVAQLTDSSLAKVASPIVLGHGGSPRVASDGASFWVAWTAAGSQLAGAHVIVDPSNGPIATGFTATTATQTAVDYDFVDLGADGVYLLWFERTTTAPPLWAVPACTLGT